MSSKRPRTPTRSSSSDDSSNSPSHPASKSTRTHLSPGSGGHKAGLQCTLPPTCNPPRNHPTLIASTKDLEAHYARYHAHVCESPACGCVFPDARLLDLVSPKIENRPKSSIPGVSGLLGCRRFEFTISHLCARPIKTCI